MSRNAQQYGYEGQSDEEFYSLTVQRGGPETREKEEAMIEIKILTCTWTDGMGSFQGRCMEKGCAWVGRWYEPPMKRALRESRALEDAKKHGESHAT